MEIDNHAKDDKIDIGDLASLWGVVGNIKI